MSRRVHPRSVAPLRARRTCDATRPLRLLVLALGLLLLQGSALLHLLVIPHAACEHGDLVDLRGESAHVLALGPQGRDAPAAAMPGDPRADARDVADAQPDRDDPGHDHCDANALRHRPEALAPSIAEATLLCIAPEVSLSERGEARPIAVLWLAPKSSPPAA